MNPWLTRSVKEVIVHRSISNDVFQNLALEDWIFHNIDMKCRRIVLLWRNQPCVVVGRHQNPWMECNTKKLRQKKVELARRRSGGGTVYHDLGNLNCTFFSNRHDYERLRNLQLACDAINSRWNLGLLATERGDILDRKGRKVSGSAAKLSKNVSYHHFTILIDVHQENLKSLLKPDENLTFFSSSATPSVPSQTVNLKTLTTENTSLTYESVCDVVSTHFYRCHHLDHNKIYDINPSSESTFPGISKLRDNLACDSWVYNKTPQFTVTDDKVNLSFTVTKGIIKDSTEPSSTHYLFGKPFQQYVLNR